jgi:hypothetical protein
MESRINITDEIFYKEFGMKNKPLLLEGYCKDWEAVKKWNSDFFISNYGDLKVKVFASVGEMVEKTVTIKEYFEYFESPTDEMYFYLKNWIFEDEASGLLNDYVTPLIFKCWTSDLEKNMKPKLRWLYIGPKGSGSPLHLDILNTSAWNGVITGKKLWNFYPPDQAKYLYDCKVDTFNPDHEKFPLFKQAKAITCVQSPGDIVFTPTGWFHQVLNTEPGISITENFINKTNYLQVYSTLKNLQKNNAGSDVKKYLDMFSQISKIHL